MHWHVVIWENKSFVFWHGFTVSVRLLWIWVSDICAYCFYWAIFIIETSIKNWGSPFEMYIVIPLRSFPCVWLNPDQLMYLSVAMQRVNSTKHVALRKLILLLGPLIFYYYYVLLYIYIYYQKKKYYQYCHCNNNNNGLWKLCMFFVRFTLILHS